MFKITRLVRQQKPYKGNHYGATDRQTDGQRDRENSAFGGFVNIPRDRLSAEALHCVCATVRSVRQTCFMFVYLPDPGLQRWGQS